MMDRRGVSSKREEAAESSARRSNLIWRKIVVPFGTATVFAGVVLVAIPEVGWMVALIAWIATVLSLGMWAVFFERL